MKLGELYRDQKYVCKVSTHDTTDLIPFDRNAKGLSDVINMSRAFMSSTAKAKTAKLSA